MAVRLDATGRPARCGHCGERSGDDWGGLPSDALLCENCCAMLWDLLGLEPADYPAGVTDDGE